MICSLTKYYSDDEIEKNAGVRYMARMGDRRDA